MHHIVVLGAGYAGLTTALRLDRRASRKVTLINATPDFTQRIRLHELIAGRPGVTVPIAELTRGTGIETVVARVTGIDLDARTVRTADGRAISYDTLVYALGSRTDVSAPGVAEHAYTVERAAELRERLRAGAGDLAVVGGGLTGIELATELAEAYPSWRVKLVAGGELARGVSAGGRAHVARVLDRLGVETVRHSRVTAVHEGGLTTENGEIAADVVIWAGSFVVPGLAAEAGLAVDARGRALVDETMRSVSRPDVYVVGDAAAVDIRGAESRMSCAAAMPIAAHAADSINARLAGREPKPFRFRYVLQCVSLGRHDALVQFVNEDDSPHDRFVSGRSGALIKEGICRFTVAGLRMSRRYPAAYAWLKGSRHAPARTLQTT
ncbi:NAD(P)/FAD-dependent oxidoreductase [Bailinhaonella thermotolerans]|uniref:FAD/NAD(P)-binding domain-containing protein n=1 Tax=Bailinhaonella thermotolerans TaxID=1070861 RepID=A0A3A4AZV7_9ACTN|nr:FAD-dependent oxidoreductase [Bailinhaonella thermotolerans]RJL33198.1 hypothetical protein D5H75_10165 [Bailinhaonella thermotolerans]